MLNPNFSSPAQNNQGLQSASVAKLSASNPASTNDVADEKLKQAIAKTQKDASADDWVALAKLYDSKQNHDEAYRCLQEALRIEDKNLRALAGLTGLLINEKCSKYNPIESFKTAKKLIELYPEKAIYWSLVGTYAANGIGTNVDLKYAVHCYFKSIALDKDNFSRWNPLGTIYLNANMFRDAHACFRHAIGSYNHQEKADGWYNLGLYFLKIGNKQKNPKLAAKCFKKATEIDSNHPYAWKALFDLIVELKILVSQAEFFECTKKCIEHSPKSPIPWWWLGHYYHYAQKYNAAFDCFKKAIELGDKQDEAWEKLAKYYECAHGMAEPQPLLATQCRKKADELRSPPLCAPPPVYASVSASSVVINKNSNFVPPVPKYLPPCPAAVRKSPTPLAAAASSATVPAAPAVPATASALSQHSRPLLYSSQNSYHNGCRSDLSSSSMGLVSDNWPAKLALKNREIELLKKEKQLLQDRLALKEEEIKTLKSFRP